MLRLVRLVPAWRVCKHRLSVSNRGIFSFSSHLFNTKNEIKPNSLLLFNNNNNVVCRGLAKWSKSDSARNQRNNVIRDLKSTEEILAMFEKEGSNYDYQNLVSSLQKISKILVNRGQINVKDQARVKVLERAAFGKINEMRGRELSSYIRSLVNLRFIAFEKETWEMINQNLMREAKTFNAQDISNTVYALGKLGNRNEEVFKTISSKIKLTNLKDFKAREIANTLCGFALADLDNIIISKDILASLSKEILRRDLKSFDELDINNIIWSFASLKIKDEKMFESFAKQMATRDVTECSPQEISKNNVAYKGLATWSKYIPSTSALLNDRIKNFNSIEEILAMFENEGSKYGYSNLVNSLHKISKMAKSRGRIDVKDQARVKVLERAAFAKINEMNARGLLNYVYSFVYLNFITIDKEAWESINRNLISKAKDFDAQGISNTVYTLGKLGNRNEEVFKAISHKIKLTNLKDFKAQEIANTLYGLALADLDNKNISKDVFASFSKEILIRDLEGFDDQNLSNIVWSFATLKVKDDNLFELIAKDIVTRDLREFKSQGISTILYSYGLAKLDKFIYKPLFEVFSKHILKERDLKSFNQQSLTEIFQSFAMLEIKDEKLFEFMGKRAEISHLNSQERSNNPRTKDNEAPSSSNSIFAAGNEHGNKNMEMFKAITPIIESSSVEAFNAKDKGVSVWDESDKVKVHNE